MHIKFLAHGTGSCSQAAGYLLGERDHAGHVRAGVEVLRGDPAQVAAVADALEFRHKYTSGVLAWAPEDAPTDAQIEIAVDEFERTAWAGIEPDRYAWCAVLHREDGGGAHVHVLAARCDLETGKSLNVAPPGWQKTFDPLRDWLNAAHGWSRPDDPQRARAVQPGPYRMHVDKARLRTGLDVEPDPRQVLGEYLMTRIEAGAVRNRDDVVAALREEGLEIPRQGKDYITVRDPESGSRWRLKGVLYEQDFDVGRLDRPVATEDRREPGDGRERADSSGRVRGPSQERAAEAWRELAERRERRAAYFRERYGGRAAALGRAAGEGLVPDAGGRDGSLAGHLARELGSGALPGVADREPDREKRRAGAEDRGPAPDAARDRESDVGDPVARGGGREVRGAAGGNAGAGPRGQTASGSLDRGRAACREAVVAVRDLYDRVRTAFDESLAGVVRAVRAGATAASRASRGLGAAGAAARRACDRLGPGLQADRRRVEQALAMTRKQALPRSKRNAPPERDRGSGFSR